MVLPSHCFLCVTQNSSVLNSIYLGYQVFSLYQYVTKYFYNYVILSITTLSKRTLKDPLHNDAQHNSTILSIVKLRITILNIIAQSTMTIIFLMMLSMSITPLGIITLIMKTIMTPSIKKLSIMTLIMGTLHKMPCWVWVSQFCHHAEYQYAECCGTNLRKKSVKIDDWDLHFLDSIVKNQVWTWIQNILLSS